MNIVDERGNYQVELEDDAICEAEGLHPEEMVMCPICRFDEYGETCIPELCGFYSG